MVYTAYLEYAYYFCDDEYMGVYRSFLSIHVYLHNQENLFSIP